MGQQYHVFLSHSRNDPVATADLAAQLRRSGLDVFKDDESIRPGDEWQAKLEAVLKGCGAFVVLVGRDGVRRWIGAETQIALNRHFGPHDDRQRLPIFPILLDETTPEQLPPMLRLFQVTRWKAGEALPADVLEAIRERNVLRKVEPIAGCPFVGLASFRPDQAHLFFGRQKETLDALACFETRSGHAPVRWLEINGNSGSGKSSLMNAGLLPLIDRGWLWSRTGFAHWARIGPMMPGEKPVRALAEALTRCFRTHDPKLEMAEVRARLQEGDELALADWLTGRKRDEGAFVLAIDQFEELFTIAAEEERRRFDRLLAAAIEDPECPLFVLSTVRADFLDRFGELPELARVRNRLAWKWTLTPIGGDALREVIEGPARLAGLDAGEVREAMVAEARDEPGALPLIENALEWLWHERKDGKLSGRLFGESGGLAGIFSSRADELLKSLEEKGQRARALELLFQLVQPDPEARRHTRRRIPRAQAVHIAGGGKAGEELILRLEGQRDQAGRQTGALLRLIIATGEAATNAGGKADPGKAGPGKTTAAPAGQWVTLIHETLIRSKGLDQAGKPQPYWPTLWTYIERNAERAARDEQLKLQARRWSKRRWFGRALLFNWPALFRFGGPEPLEDVERRYLQWSRIMAALQIAVVAAISGLVAEAVHWTQVSNYPLETAAARMRRNLGFPSLPTLVPIKPGKFRMGERDCKDDNNRYACPAHEVTLPGFEMGAYEVTFDQWAACLADGGCGGYMPSDEAWGRSDRPVINVNWENARAFADWLGAHIGKSCRLPSEAEWEYAARAGTTDEFAVPPPLGTGNIEGKGLANCNGCGRERDVGRTAPVGTFEANAWGLYDMHGNVEEWVEDCRHGNYEGAPADGSVWRSEDEDTSWARGVRGGSWSDLPDFARAAFRFGSYPDIRRNSLGFRVVCSSPILPGTEP